MLSQIIFLRPKKSCWSVSERLYYWTSETAALLSCIAVMILRVYRLLKTNFSKGEKHIEMDLYLTAYILVFVKFKQI